MPKKICLFTGAGISAPLGLPVTTGFKATINKIEPRLLGFIGTFLGKESNDIERVLYVLEGFAAQKDFLYHILKSNTTGVLGDVNTIAGSARIAINLIKSDIYTRLSHSNASEAYGLYKNIIGEIRQSFEKTSISMFTTNYDLTFENACYHHRDGFRQLGINTVEDCFRSEWSKNMYTPDIDFNWDPEKLEYIKLHGSLDWTYDSNGACVKSGAANLPANLEQMPIIYPGHKNITDKEPFKSTHDRLFSRLNVADYVIVIGFAFRDQLINSHFESALRINKALKIYCYNPCPLNEYPEDSQLSYFANTFKNRFIHVQSKVEIKEKPLSFSGHFNKLTPINSNDII